MGGQTPDARRFGRIVAHSDVITERFGSSDYVGRQWLVRKLESWRSSSERGQLILVGRPGSGKSSVLAHLAESWNAPRHFIRVDHVGGVSGVDARAFLVSLGAQLFQKYGPEIFDRAAEGGTRVTVGWARGESQVVGRVIDEFHSLPFLAVDRDVEVRVGAATSGSVVIGERIRKLVDVTLALDPRTLLHAGVLWPLHRLQLLHPDERVVILIDALDEAQRDGDLPQVIPRPADQDFPTNLALLMTSRPGAHLAIYPSADQLDLDSDDYREDRRRDTVDYINVRTARPPLQGTLSDWETKRRRTWVEQVAKESEDNFLYLYHFFNEAAEAVSAGDHALKKLRIPKGLDDIYRAFAVDKIRHALADSLRFTVSAPISALLEQRWREIPGVLSLIIRGAQVTAVSRAVNPVVNAVLASVAAAGITISDLGIQQGAAGGRWEEKCLPVLGVLAVAFEALAPDEIAAVSRVELEWVDSMLGQLRQFLQGSDEGRRFRLFHSSFAGYLLDAERNRDSPISGPEYHGRFAAHYCGEDLAGAAASEFSFVSPYPYRHLAAHLRHAGRTEALFQLVDNRAWYLAQRTRNPSHAEYLNDLLEADHAAADADAAALGRGQSAPMLDREISCVLALSSVRSLLSEIPVECLALAVDSGLWPAHWALMVTRQNPDDYRRIDALLTVADRLDVAARARIVSEVLETVCSAGTSIENLLEHTTGRLLSVPLAEVDRLRTVIRTADNPGDLAAQLALLARLAPREMQEGIFEEAHAAVAALDDANARSRAFQRLLSAVPEAFRPRVLPDAFESVRALPAGSEWRARRFADLFAYLPRVSQREEQELLAMALAIPWIDRPEDGISMDQDRGRALRDVVGVFSGATLDAAIEAIRALPPGMDRDLALASAGKRLASMGRQQEALLYMAEIEDFANLVIEGLAHLPPFLSTELQLENCLRIAHRSTDHPHPWIQRLVAIRFAQLRQSARAIELARSIDSPPHRTEALCGVVAALDEAPPAELVAQALEAARVADVSEGSVLESSLMKMALRLAGDGRIDEALAGVRTFPDHSANGAAGPRAEALTHVAAALPTDSRKALAAEALTVAQRVGDDLARIRAVASWLGNYRPPIKGLDEVLEQSIAASRHLERDEDKAETFLALARLVSDDLRQRVLEASREIADPNWRLKALAGLSSLYTGAARDALMQEAILLAESQPWGRRELDGLVELVRVGGAEDQRAVVSIAAGLPDILTSIGPLLAPELQQEALALAQQLPTEAARVIALSGLASLLPEDAQHRVLDWIRADFDARTVDASRSMQADYERASRRLLGVPELIDMLPTFVSHFARSVLPAVLDLARKVGDAELRARITAKAAMRLIELGGIDEALEISGHLAWDHGSHDEGCPSFRALVVFHALNAMPDHARAGLLKSSLGETRGVSESAPRSYALGLLLPFVSGRRHRVLFGEALNCANDIMSEQRGTVLSSLAHSASGDQIRALLAAIRRADEETFLEERVRAAMLANLAGKAGELALPEKYALWREMIATILARRRDAALTDLVALTPLMFALAGDHIAESAVVALARAGELWP